MQWGTYTIDKGGTLAVREKDIPALTEALQDIRNGKTTIAEALYTKNKKGETVARFDVYGMEPGFLEKNYDSVTLKPETQERLKAFSCRPAATEQQRKRPRRNR
jgi:hypothetical protein